MPAPPDLITEAYLETLFEDIPTAKAEKIIAIVSARCKRWCRHNFYTDTYTEYHSGANKSSIILKRTPVLSVASVHDDLNRLWGSDSLIDPVYYNLDTRLSTITLNPGMIFRRWNGNIRVVYTAGWGAAESDLPEDLKGAVAKWAAIEVLNWDRGNSRLGLKSVREGDLQVNYDKDSPPSEVRPDLAPFRALI